MSGNAGDIQDICAGTDRYCMYKVGPVLSISVSERPPPAPTHTSTTCGVLKFPRQPYGARLPDERQRPSHGHIVFAEGVLALRVEHSLTKCRPCRVRGRRSCDSPLWFSSTAWGSRPYRSCSMSSSNCSTTPAAVMSFSSASARQAASVSSSLQAALFPDARCVRCLVQR